MTRIADAAQWLAAEISASLDEFRQAHQPGGDMLLTALQTHGYAREQNRRVGLTEQGRRMVQAERPA
jgi:hypothetical protein